MQLPDALREQEIFSTFKETVFTNQLDDA